MRFLSGSFSQTTTLAPFQTASAMKSWPSNFSPLIATKHVPLLTFFELYATDVTDCEGKPINSKSSVFSNKTAIVFSLFKLFDITYFPSNIHYIII